MSRAGDSRSPAEGGNLVSSTICAGIMSLDGRVAAKDAVINSSLRYVVDV